MNLFDLLFSPKGTIEPKPFALVVVGVYLINIVAGSTFDGQFIMRAGIWPYLGLQVLLTWIWFAVHSKRLRDAGKGSTVAFIIAFLYLAGIIAMISFAAGSVAAVTQSAEPSQQQSGSLIGVLIAILFIHTLLTGDPVLIVGFFVLLIGFPFIFALIVAIYSIVTGARPGVSQDAAPVPQQQQIPPA